MDDVLVNIGWKPSTEHCVVRGLRSRIWHGWAVMGIAIATGAGLHHIWPKTGTSGVGPVGPDRSGAGRLTDQARGA